MLIYKFDLFQQYAPCAFFPLFCVPFSRKNKKNNKKEKQFFVFIPFFLQLFVFYARLSWTV